MNSTNSADITFLLRHFHNFVKFGVTKFNFLVSYRDTSARHFFTIQFHHPSAFIFDYKTGGF